MPKGYWIANIEVHDTEAYEAYKLANAEPFAKYGGRFLVRAGHNTPKEGDILPRVVVIEFPTYADALACYESDLYQDAKAIRDPISEGRLVIAEGLEN